MKADSVTIEYRAILGLIPPNASVLDLGCGDGELLAILADRKQHRLQGIEIDDQAIYRCVAKGLSVLHGDIDEGLADFGDGSFDYVILNQTFQQVKQPDRVLRESLRVGKEVIVSFPNFAHYLSRIQIALRGRTPVTSSLPYQWFDTPNLHFLSISDFIAYCRKNDIRIKKSCYIGRTRRIHLFPNLCAMEGIFLITDGKTGG